jgi:hypothetical protein
MTVAFLAAWLAVWASGSRTAFASAAVATTFSLFAFRESVRGLLSRARLPHLAGAVAIAVVAVWLVAHANPQIVGPITRLRETLPQPSVASIRQFAWDMWDRNRYGSVATSMIERFPLFGIGISCFHMMVNDFVAKGEIPLIQDNAQNWYRHQLAELGVLGSLGWIAWVAVFGWFVLWPPRPASREAWIARGMLIGFAAVSLVGLPAQTVAVSFTFWTLAFWYASLAGSPPSAPMSRRAWMSVAAIALIFAAGTTISAVGDLRVPVRAQRVGWPFIYGFYYPEPDGEGGEYRWARQRATAVVDAPSRVLALSVWVNHRDIETRPVDVKAWCDGTLVLQSTLNRTSRITKYVSLPPGEKRVVVDTWVSRVVHPKDLGVEDSRELGLMVKWAFVDRVPDGETATELR